MSLPRISKKARLSAAIAMSLFSASVSTLYAMPADGVVKSGDATISPVVDNTMNINQTTDRVAIDWTSFDIAHGETVNFNQPGADSIALNRINGNDATQIYGTLNANGQVFLINPHGVLFGKGASVDVGGLYASTANVNDAFMKEFGNNKDGFSLEIDKDNTAAIINQATINAKIKDEGGLVVLHAANVVLHAANVDNEGTITTDKGGKVQLAAGKTLNINYDSAKINFIVDGGLSEANVLNAGTISAQNGVIAMTARGADKVLSSVVNTENATLEAKRLGVNEKGEIFLDAGTGVVGISGTVDVSGTDGAAGGTILAKGGSLYIDGTLNANGANGGTIATTADNMVVTNKAVISAAGNGTNGTWNVNTTKNVDIKDVSENIDSIKQKLAAAKTEVDKLFETARLKHAEAEAAKQALDAAQEKVNKLTELINKQSDKTEKEQAFVNAAKELTEAEGDLAKAKEIYEKLAIAAKDATQTATDAETVYNKVSDAAGKVTDAYNTLQGKTYGVITGTINYINFESSYNALRKTAKEELQSAYLKHLNSEEGFVKLFGNVLNFIDSKLPDISLGLSSDQYKASQDILATYKNVKDIANYVKTVQELNGECVTANKGNLNSGTEKLVAANKDYAQKLNSTVGTNGVAISNTVLSSTLNGTNVNITTNNAHQLSTDIVVSKEITKSEGKATNLTLTADRNVVFNAGVTSDKELNLTTKAGSKIEKTAGVREGELYGANIVKADITTNGDVTLENNSYIGFNGEDKARTISAKNVKFGGNVVLATGDTVTVKAEENVTFGGSINSGNAYSYEELTNADIKDVTDYWEKARAKAKGNIEGGSKVGDSYLATITDGIEDSAVTAVLPTKKTAYVGGVASAWETDADGKRSRVWKWADGPEAEKSFFTQTAQKGKDDTKTAYSFKVVNGEATNGYANFCSGEPNDDSYKQPVLSVGYTDTGRGETDYNTSRWDDLFNKDSGKVKGYIKETNLENSSLNVEAGKDISLGAVGNTKALGNISLKGETVKLSDAITTNNDIEIYGAIKGKEISLNSNDGNIVIGTPKAENKPLRMMLKATNVGVDTMESEDKISLSAGKNVTLNGVLKAGSNEKGAVQISAGGAFINKAGENAIQTGAGGTWQIFSATPDKDEFNGLNSNNTAIWNATGTVDNGGKNTYSFAIQPTLTVKANDVEKTYGDVSTGSGVTVTNSIAEMKDAKGADLSTAFTDTLDAAKLLTGDVDVTSEGFAATATRRGGDYKGTDGKVVSENLVAWGKEYTDEEHQVKPYYEINVNGAANDTGYKVVTEKGKLTVNKADLTINVGHAEADYGTSYSDVKKLFTAEADGFKNDDSLDGVKYTTNAYKEDGRTKNVGSYYLDINQWPFVYNYEIIKYHQGSVKINPKDVNLSIGGFEPEGSSVRILEGTPTYESQLVNGDTVETAPKVSYEVGAQSEGLNYGIDYYVDGKKISSGDTVGNYRFNYNTAAVITLDNPEGYKPQTNELMTSAVALKGNADVELSQKTAKVDGVDKVAGLMDGRLPLFKFAGSQVIPCGMFDISSTPDSVTMTASKISETDMSAAMEMPELEVNQYREYDRMLDTVDGAAAFKLTYNGASFDIYPNDNQAKALLEKGEETNNVNVGVAALSAAFGEMKLSLDEMQVICVHMDAKEILA